MKEIFKYMPLRIFSYYHEAKQILRGEMPKPGMIYWWPTYVCNHNCLGCDWAALNRTKSTIISDAWKKVFEELSQLNSIRTIELGGGGEALLHPDIHEMIKRAASYGWTIGVLTNGTMLKGDLLQDLIKNSAYIRVSMESGSEKVFNKVKRPLTEETGFKAVVDNLINAVELSRKINPNCNIGYKFTVSTENYRDMENAIILARDIGCSSIQFKANRNTDFELSEFMRHELDEQLQKFKEAYKQDHIEIIGSLAQTKMTTKCFMTPIHILIDAFGDCYLCCYSRHRMYDNRIGNIIRDGFQKIWYSPSHQEIIKRISLEMCNKYDCKFFTYNKLMDDLMVKTRELDIV